MGREYKHWVAMKKQWEKEEQEKIDKELSDIIKGPIKPGAIVAFNYGGDVRIWVVKMARPAVDRYGNVNINAEVGHISTVGDTKAGTITKIKRAGSICFIPKDVFDLCEEE